MSQIPSVIALPAEMQIGTVDSSLPPAARANNMRIFPTNVSSVTSSTVSQVTAGAAYVPDGTMPSTTIIFDLPAGTSPSTFLDPRTLTLNFRMTVTQTVVAAANITSAYVRSSGYSFFDRFYVNTQNGIAEDITEYGLVADTLLNMTQNESQRDGTALLYGMNGIYNNNGNQGTSLNIYNGRATAANDTQTLSFSIPVISSLVGCTANKFFNIGRTSKLQLAFQTTNIVPISMLTNAANGTGSHTVTLSDFFINMSTVDIGSEALRMLDAGLIDGKAYYSGTTYRTSSSTIAATSTGVQSLLVGVRGSSVKSLVARFYDGLPADATGSVNGKYDSKLPNANSINFNVQGVGRLPNVPVNPLLYPSNSFRETQLAFGCFNSSTHTSAILPSLYCKLCLGGNNYANTLTTQDARWTTGTTNAGLSSYFFGVDTEVVARRGLFSGMNCLSSPIFLELNIANAITNAVTAYVTAMLDVVYIHDTRTGDISTRV